MADKRGREREETSSKKGKERSPYERIDEDCGRQHVVITVVNLPHTPISEQCTNIVLLRRLAQLGNVSYLDWIFDGRTYP